MKFQLATTALDQITTDVLVAFLPETPITSLEKKLDRLLAGRLQNLRRSLDFVGEFKTHRLLLPHHHGAAKHGLINSRILLLGLGKRATLDLEILREAVGLAIQELKKLPIKRATLVGPEIPKVPVGKTIQAITEAAILQNYEFRFYKKAETPRRPELTELTLLLPKKQERAQAATGLALGQLLGQIVTVVRDLGNHPANQATPSHLARHAQQIARTTPNLKVKILHEREIAAEKMGAFLAVAQGSNEEPKFIVLEYRPKKTAPTIVLIGKGVTFDSGGISLKPAEKMEEMKFDMAGAATVMGIVQTAAKLQLPLNVIGLVPATENLPSGKASKPGDIVKSRSGQSIEIINTDAEGRLILADALDYAKQYHPALVIDLATLTGAMVVSLGEEIAGAFSNHEKYLQQLQAAAAATGEKIWPMPLEKTYDEFLKSDFADLRNIGTNRYGDAIIAADFLQHFVDYPWIHLDIAGVAWTTREKPYRPKGATGTSLRLIVEFLRKFKK